VSFNADYINWFPKKQTIKNIIAIEDDEVSEKEKSLFKHIYYKGRIDNHFAREYGTTIYLFTGGPDSLSQILNTLIAQKKRAYRY
jgi:hypothetical protein